MLRSVAFYMGLYCLQRYPFGYFKSKISEIEKDSVYSTFDIKLIHTRRYIRSIFFKFHSLIQSTGMELCNALNNDRMRVQRTTHTAQI